MYVEKNGKKVKVIGNNVVDISAYLGMEIDKEVIKEEVHLPVLLDILEKMEGKDEKALRAEIELYDLNGNLVSLPLSKNNRMSSNQLKTILVVPEDNDYYISINSRYDSDANIKIKNYEYSTLVDFENNYKITEKFNYEGIIEGKYDFESFEYENESPLSQNRHDHCRPCRCGLADPPGETQPVAG